MLIKNQPPLVLLNEPAKFPPALRARGLAVVMLGDSERHVREVIKENVFPIETIGIKWYHVPPLFQNKLSRVPTPVKNRVTKGDVPRSLNYRKHIKEYRDYNVFVNLGRWTELVQSKMRSINRKTISRLPEVIHSESKQMLQAYQHKHLSVIVTATTYNLLSISKAEQYLPFQSMYAMSKYQPDLLVEFFSFYDSCSFFNPDTRDGFTFTREQLLEDNRFRFAKFRKRIKELSNNTIEDEEDPTQDQDTTKPVQSKTTEKDSEERDTTLDNEKIDKFLQNTVSGRRLRIRLSTLDPDEQTRLKLKIQRDVTDGKEPDAIEKDLESEIEQEIQDQNFERVAGPRLVRKVDDITPTVVKHDQAPTLDDNVRTSSLKGFNQSYIENSLERDIESIFESFANKNEKTLDLLSVEKTNTSDALNRKDTWRVRYKDESGSIHSIKVDVPRIFEGNKIRIGGSNKSITNQILRLPVVKTSFNTAVITTNSNKVTLEVPREGSMIAEVRDILDLIDRDEIPERYYSRGNVSKDNTNLVVSVDYQSISRKATAFNIDGKRFVFSQLQLQRELTEHLDIKDIQEQIESDWGRKFRERFFITGYVKKTGELIYYDFERSHVLYKKPNSSNITTPEKDINTIGHEIYRLLSEQDDMQLDKPKKRKKMSHTIVTISKKNIPLAVLVCVREGIEAIFEKKNIAYRFVPKDEKSKPDYPNKIKFKDGTLYYKDRNVASMLITNGLYAIEFSDMTWQEANEPPTAYLDYFIKKYGGPDVLRLALNIIASLVDPLTAETCRDLGLPTDTINLMIYASDLLDNAYFLPVNDPRNYRVRGAEVMPAMLAKTLSDAYSDMLIKSRQGRNVKMSIKQNELTNRMLSDRLVDDITVLNPVNLAENVTAKTTYKGSVGGINMSFAFDSDQGEPRKFHKDYRGKFALSTPDSENVGIIKHLTSNMAIDNTRGYMLDQVDEDDLNAANMLSISEQLSPFTSKHSDPSRTAMKILCRPTV